MSDQATSQIDDQDTNGNFDDDAWNDAIAAETSPGSDAMWEPVSTVPGETDQATDPTGEEGSSPEEARPSERPRDSAGRFVSRASAAEERTETSEEETDESRESAPEAGREGVSELNPHLVDVAHRIYGLSEEDLQGISTNDELTRTLRVIDRQARQWQQHVQGQQPQQHAQQQQPQQAQQPQPQAAQQDFDPLAGLDLSSLDEEDPIRRSLETMAGVIRQVIPAVSAQQQYYEQQQQAELNRRIGTFEQGLSEFLGQQAADLYGNPGEQRSIAQEQYYNEVKETAAQLVIQEMTRGADFYAIDMRPLFAAAQARHQYLLSGSAPPPASGNGQPANGGRQPLQQRHPQADAIARRSQRRSGVANRTSEFRHRNRIKDPETWANGDHSPELEETVNSVFQRMATR